MDYGQHLNQKKLIIEVKTTDAYRIDLETVSKYRKELIKRYNYNEDDLSILYIVGREDTGGLESQVRGSRHAWDIRMISIDALIKLMLLKEDLDDPNIVQKIHEILIPKEYTKLDEIADLLFFTAEEVKQADEEDSHVDKVVKGAKTPKVNFRESVIDELVEHFNTPLIKKSFASYVSSDKTTHIVCAVSKEYNRSNKKYYWYAFHPHQKDFLEKSQNGFIALGCGSEKTILLIPIKDFLPNLERMNTTTKDNGKTYWHIHIALDNNEFDLVLKKGYKNISIGKYKM